MLYRECSSNVIVFSWAPNNHSAYYYARGVDSTGKVMECMATEKSCFFTDTTCGRLYNFTVSGSSSSFREQCSTATSSMMQIRTGNTKHWIISLTILILEHNTNTFLWLCSNNLTPQHPAKQGTCAHQWTVRLVF